MKLTKTTLLVPVLTVAMVGSGAVAGYASVVSADTTDTTRPQGLGLMMGDAPERDGDHVRGTVTAINGSTIVITDERDSTTYTIDASTADFVKAERGQGPSSASITDIAVGDTIGAHGTLNGTTLEADHVMTGDMGPRGGEMGRGNGRGSFGTVTAVNGSTITLTTPNGETVTVDASDASFSKVVSGSISDVAVGENISFHGDRSDGTVTADHIMTGMPFAQRTGQ